MSVTYDSPYGTLPTATRDGYEFQGWYTTETGGIQVTDSTIVNTPYDHTLYAHWKAMITITVNSVSKVYDGMPLTGSWELTSGTLETGDRLEVTVVGSITEVGTAVNKIISVKVMHDDTDVTENYIIHKVDGHLKITEKPQDDSQSEQEGIDKLINGKVETAAFATITREGDKTVVTVIIDMKK